MTIMEPPKAFFVETKGTEPVKQRLISSEKGLLLLELETKALPDSGKPTLTVSFETPDRDITGMWSPTDFQNKKKRPHWANTAESNLTHGVPILAALAGNDRNRVTVACSDTRNSVGFVRFGTLEESGLFSCVLRLCVPNTEKNYRATVRVDLRDLPFTRVIKETAAWWETFDGCTPAEVPPEAKKPMYSTWYGFHHDLHADTLLAECAFFSDCGCEAVIVDGGWYHASLERGGAYCGDWEPAPNKIPDMKALVDSVHALGMKFILWYSVSFVGIRSALYQKWKDKTVGAMGFGGAYALDPRYPEIREYLIDTYANAVTTWGVDGFKFDFLDFFKESDTVEEGMDCLSVSDAVDRLMKDVLARLRSLDPHILIEFRHPYESPHMRSFGNMLRAEDCPGDAYTNRQNTLLLRLLAGKTAVHSDMLMWHESDSAENAAFQLTNVLFAVPQISLLHEKLPQRHKEMLRHYLSFWKAHAGTLLDGELYMRGFMANYAYVSARKDGEQIGAVYTGRIATVEVPTDTVILVNASHDECVYVEGVEGEWTYEVTDCTGKPFAKGNFKSADRKALNRVDAPVNGYITLQRQP